MKVQACDGMDVPVLKKNIVKTRRIIAAAITYILSTGTSYYILKNSASFGDHELLDLLYVSSRKLTDSFAFRTINDR